MWLRRVFSCVCLLSTLTVVQSTMQCQLGLDKEQLNLNVGGETQSYLANLAAELASHATMRTVDCEGMCIVRKYTSPAGVGSVLDIY